MTDKEKIAMLEKENRALRIENQELHANEQEMAEISERLRSAMATVEKLQKNVEETSDSLRRFKPYYLKACEEAMKATVKPYAKALRVVKRKRHKSKSENK